eukprot:15257216-Heterocapsa_arctica.AAC.2
MRSSAVETDSCVALERSSAVETDSRVARWCPPLRPSPVWHRSQVERLPVGQLSDVDVFGVQNFSAWTIYAGAA